MSNTAKGVLDVARSQIGTIGGKRYWDYVIGSGYVSGSATPWCACFVSWCFWQAGAKCVGLPAASCTYQLYVRAKKAGKVVPMAQAKSGDVILFNFDRNDGDAEHVGIIESVGGGSFVTIEGNTSSASNAAGNTVARRTRAKSTVFAIVRPDYDSAVKQPDSKRTNDFGLAYRAHVQTGGWLPVVHDGQVAGTVGQALRLEALKFTPPAGVRLTVNAHMQGIGWRSYENIERGKYDPVIGSTGEGRRLEAVQIHADGLPEGKHIRYRAHVQGVGWQPWVSSGMTAGTTGKRLRMEAIQVEIV